MPADYSKLAETQEKVVAKMQESLLGAHSLSPDFVESIAKAIEIHVGVLETLEARRSRADRQ